MNKYLYFSFLSIFILLGCINDNEEDYFSDQDCNLVDLSYELSIVTIINSKCISCHSSNSNSVNLTSYDNLLNLSSEVYYQIDNNLMPPSTSTPLTDCEELQIKTWINNGATE